MKHPSKNSWRRENAFESYLLMGQSRSLVKLAQLSNTHIETLNRWSRQFKWQARIQEADDKALAIMKKDNEKLYLENIKIGHQKLYKELQDKAMSLIRKKTRVSKFDTVKDLTIAADVAIKGERTTLGLNETKLKGGIMREGFMAMLEVVMQNNNGS